MKDLQTLLKLVKKANKEQIASMIWDFEMIGFYREDKRQKKSFIIECLKNCYTTEKTLYDAYDQDSLRMEKSVLTSIK